MQKVRIDPHADQKLKSLISTLFEEEYFATREGAKNYIKAIYQFCNTIPSKALRPVRNKSFGDYYCQYKANNRTTWYIVFSIEDDVCVITDVLNNHSVEYTAFITGEE